MKTVSLARLSLLAFFAIVVGCSSPAQPGRMKVTDLKPAKRFDKTVAVQTSGGQPTSSAWLSQVADPDLAQAICESLKSSGLFSAVVNVGQGDVVLNATIANLKQPMGFGATYIEIVWSLTPKGQTQPCWEKLVNGRGTSGHFVGVTRVRHAVEAAVQDNIRKALTELAKVQLPEAN
jgi:hypothetical protein